MQRYHRCHCRRVLPLANAGTSQIAHRVKPRYSFSVQTRDGNSNKSIS
jgi:hypothetical protein